MSSPGLLPQRWRTQSGDPHRAEDLVAVLETAPIAPVTDGLVLCAQAGSQMVLPLLVALKSLHHRLGRGRCVVHDDGTLTGSDRTTLAYHLGDPPIIAPGACPLGGFPDGEAWEPLLAAYHGRAGEYWLVVDAHGVALGPVFEIAAAISANRSLAGPGLLGLAAGGPRRPDPENFLAARNEDRKPMRTMLLERETAPVILSTEKYRANPGQKSLGACEFAAFGKRSQAAAAAHASASRIALSALGR